MNAWEVIATVIMVVLGLTLLSVFVIMLVDYAERKSKLLDLSIDYYNRQSSTYKYMRTKPKQNEPVGINAIKIPLEGEDTLEFLDIKIKVERCPLDLSVKYYLVDLKTGEKSLVYKLFMDELQLGDSDETKQKLAKALAFDLMGKLADKG